MELPSTKLISNVFSKQFSCLVDDISSSWIPFLVITQPSTSSKIISHMIACCNHYLSYTGFIGKLIFEVLYRGVIIFHHLVTTHYMYVM